MNKINKSKNKKYYLAKYAKYRASKIQATLRGLDKQIISIYKNCPKGYEVDHIIPLKGKNVCGLHVPWNLQYLTRYENRSKGNKIVGQYGC